MSATRTPGTASSRWRPCATITRHTGTGVPDAYDLWATRTRTRLSDCEACETRRGVHQVFAGDDAGALDTWRPVLDDSVSCSDEPQMSQAHALLPLLRLGRTDEARSHHLTGYRQVRGRTGMQEEVGLHLEFCALSRNSARGVEILAENRPLFEATGAPLARLGFLTGTEVLLALLVEEGHADTPVGGPPGRNRTAGELLAEVREEQAGWRPPSTPATAPPPSATRAACGWTGARSSTSRCRSACAPRSPAPPPFRPPPRSPPRPARSPGSSPNWSARHAGWPPSATPATPRCGTGWPNWRRPRGTPTTPSSAPGPGSAPNSPNSAPTLSTPRTATGPRGPRWRRPPSCTRRRAWPGTPWSPGPAPSPGTS
ncbi:hypothetical protein ACW23B_29200 [Streptomyces albidoflavus]